MNFLNSNKRTKIYWINRGWSNDAAYIKSKEYSKSLKSSSIYSQSHWLAKINPKTNQFYTIEEADFERNSRRPIRKEYWMNKGFDEHESVKLAMITKDSNNKKGAKSQIINHNRLSSKRCIEYYTSRNFSKDEAISIIKQEQTKFSKKMCIEKYGIDLGTQIWQDRQIKWKNSLKNSGIYLGVSKISLKLFNKISETIDLQFGEQEACIIGDNRLYFVDCLQQTNKKIIEFYGDYWHANPNKFTEDMISKNRTAKSIWEIDNKRIEELEKLGYKVLIVWENEVYKNFEDTVNKCIHFLNS